MAGPPGTLSPLPTHIEIIEPDPDDCSHSSLPPEGNVKHRNYRMLSENLRAYTPTGDIHTSPTKGKLVSKFDVCSTISPPRQRILELLRPEDPGRDALEAIVRPAPRRGLTRPLDDDTRRFLQRALLSPSPQCFSNAATPEPYSHTPEPGERHNDVSDRCLSVNSCYSNFSHDSPAVEEHEREPDKLRSLADELREAEEEERSGERKKEIKWHGADIREAFERERLGKLALSVEEDEGECDGLTVAARKLDALLAESRGLHAELAGIHQDMQAACARACRCTAAARALVVESRALHYLDDVVALLRGDVAKAGRARLWPFAIGRRVEGRNYVV